VPIGQRLEGVQLARLRAMHQFNVGRFVSYLAWHIHLCALIAPVLGLALTI
jgi:hypothetical protein